MVRPLPMKRMEWGMGVSSMPDCVASTQKMAATPRGLTATVALLLRAMAPAEKRNERREEEHE